MLILCACTNPFYPVYLGNGGGRGDNSGGAGGGAPTIPLPASAGLYRMNDEGTEWDLVTGSPLAYPIQPSHFYSQVSAYLSSHSGEYLMLVGEGLTTTTNMDITQDRKLTIQSMFGGPYSIRFNGANNFISVNNGTLILKDITLVGNNLNSSALVKVLGAAYTKLTMYFGSTIRGNTNTIANGGDGRGGGVSVAGAAVFALAGGRIDNNMAQYGGGVYAVGGSSFTMSGSASIESNTVMRGGGFNNEAHGGGVYVESIFEMEGGTINNNDAAQVGGSGKGGGVYVAAGGHFRKAAGDNIYLYGDNDLVTQNTASDQGAAVYVNSSPVKYRNSTAGPTQSLNSDDAPGTNGWD